MLLWVDNEVGRPLKAQDPWSPCTATSKVPDTPFAIACKRDAHLHELVLGHQIIETVARAKDGKGARTINVEELISAIKENEGECVKCSPKVFTDLRGDAEICGVCTPAPKGTSRCWSGVLPLLLNLWRLVLTERPSKI